MVRHTASSSTVVVQPPSPLDPSNQSSPYFVHPSENPAISLVTTKLTPNNYHAWARLMKKALIGKNKFKFADGSFAMPDSFDPLYDAWERCNNLVHSWIINSVSPAIAQSIVYKELASEAWNNLKVRFARVDRVRVVDLKYEIYHLKQESQSVTDYYTELCVLLEELDNYRPRPECSCAVKCTCDALKNARLFHDEDAILCFLKGLNDDFAMVRTQIYLMNPLPPITTVFSMVLEHERQNGLAPASEDSSVMINAVDGRRSFTRGKSGGVRQCTYCNRSCHTVNTCYKKHGFSFNPKRDARPSANAVSANSAVSTEKSDSVESINAVSRSISPEDYKQLVDLLKRCNFKTDATTASAPIAKTEESSIN